MDIQKCKCGKASATYKVIGEDLWSLVAVNSTISEAGFCKAIHCIYCLDRYDTFDPCMVKISK